MTKTRFAAVLAVLACAAGGVLIAILSRSSQDGQQRTRGSRSPGQSASGTDAGKASATPGGQAGSAGEFEKAGLVELAPGWKVPSYRVEALLEHRERATRALASAEELLTRIRQLDPDLNEREHLGSLLKEFSTTIQYYISADAEPSFLDDLFDRLENAADEPTVAFLRETLLAAERNEFVVEKLRTYSGSESPLTSFALQYILRESERLSAAEQPEWRRRALQFLESGNTEDLLLQAAKLSNALPMEQEDLDRLRILLLRSSSPSRALAAARALGVARLWSDEQLLQVLLGSADAHVRQGLVAYLTETGSQDVIKSLPKGGADLDQYLLTEAHRDNALADDVVGYFIARVCAGQQPPSGYEELLYQTAESARTEPSTLIAVAQALPYYPNDKSVTLLEKLSTHHNEEVWLAALASLFGIGYDSKQLAGETAVARLLSRGDGSTQAKLLEWIENRLSLGEPRRPTSGIKAAVHVLANGSDQPSLRDVAKRILETDRKLDP